jgi:prophage DNA circulation protein
MSWLDQLQKASWRGVTFEVDTVEVRAGDNVVLREYPFADLPNVFRMGTAAETVRLTAYVIGDDYLERRDQLRQALTGTGTLIHPTAGAMRASLADTYTMREAPLREGGVVRFDLTFVRAEPRTYPSTKPSTQAQAAAAASNAKAAAVAQFGKEFSLAGAPAWVQDRVVDRLSGMTDGLWSQIKGATSGITDFTDNITGVYQVLQGGLADLVKTPAALAGSVRQLMSLPAELQAGAGASFRAAYEAVFGVGSTVHQTDFEAVIQPTSGQLAIFGAGDPTAISLDTAARSTLGQLNGACDKLYNTMALAAWVEVVAADDLAGYEDVVAQRKWLHDRCMTMLQAASEAPAALTDPDSSWHDAVLAMLAAALADMMARGADRSRLSAYQPQVCMSVWQLSYLLYGTTDWADELLANNPHIWHPLVVPAGQEVRVVRHG